MPLVGAGPVSFKSRTSRQWRLTISTGVSQHRVGPGSGGKWRAVYIFAAGSAPVSAMLMQYAGYPR
jgi:hypothetical protein